MTTYFISEEHKVKMEGLIVQYPVAKTDRLWALAFYLIAHPDVFPHYEIAVAGKSESEIAELTPFRWYFDGDVDLGSAAHGLFELARHLFTGGRNEFRLDQYLYKWDGRNFEVAMSLIRTAKNGLNYPKPLSELIEEGRIG